MLLKELLALSRREMAAVGIAGGPEPEILVSALARVPRSRLLPERDRDVGDPTDTLRGWIARRAAGEPIQYILGAWDFFGREFLLTRDTLIPRPETEGLVERVIDAWGRGTERGGRFLDVGTGSGAIAVTLAAELPRVKVVAADVSAPALAVARENARRLGVSGRVLFLRAESYSALKCGDRFDVVVSNPPYVSEREWNFLPAEVRDFEPPGALRAGPDGLSVLRVLVAHAGEYLVPGGQLWCEIGETQGEAVRRLPSGFLRFGGLFRDLGGRDRVARWKKSV
ncbi:MAG: peptide chain release factor N(5)-glutamine methyltransferase [Deltaproteobacteria bacterium]|nr:peptide chain release factor N(5)-glutamine methyltransferase [Deltaproteobacteria bacterium]